MGVTSRPPSAVLEEQERDRERKSLLEEMLPYLERAALEHGANQHIVFFPDTRDLVRRIRGAL